jgi:MraZ protein
MLLGQFSLKVDEKGRFFLPAKYRPTFADGLVLTKNQERSLAIWTPTQFEAQAARIMAGLKTLREQRDFQRGYASAASEQAPDRQGRVVIPQVLRDYAGLDKDIVVIGAMDRLEVWDAAAWAAGEGDLDQAFAELDQEVGPVT